MKTPLKWKAILFGILTAIGISVIGYVGVTLLLWGMVGRSIGSIRHPGPLLTLLGFVILALSYLVAGYVTSKMSRPHGLKHAIIVALACVLPELLIYPSVLQQVQLILPFLFCAAGAFCVRQS